MDNDSRPDNIIKGPWKKNRRKVIIPETENAKRVTEDMAFVEDFSEALLIQMIHTMSENSINIKNEKFIRDIGFIDECVKSVLFRELGYPHPITNLIERIMTSDKQSTERIYTQFDVEKLVKMLQNSEEKK